MREMGKEGEGESGVGAGVEVEVLSGRDWAPSGGSEKHQYGTGSRALEKGQIKGQS